MIHLQSRIVTKFDTLQLTRNVANTIAEFRNMFQITDSYTLINYDVRIGLYKIISDEAN